MRLKRLSASVKHEDVYLKGHATMGVLMLGLTKYFDFYNQERPHQSLGNQTPAEVYKTASGGGALIVDKFKDRSKQFPIALRSKATTFEEIQLKNSNGTITNSQSPEPISGKRRLAEIAIDRCNLNWAENCPGYGVHFSQRSRADLTGQGG